MIIKSLTYLHHVIGNARFKLYGFPNDIELPFRIALKSRVLYSISKYVKNMSKKIRKKEGTADQATIM